MHRPTIRVVAIMMIVGLSHFSRVSSKKWAVAFVANVPSGRTIRPLSVLTNGLLQTQVQTSVALAPAKLRWKCDPDQFDFKTTAELGDDILNVDGLLGQERAESAIKFGVSMKREGYNLYVQGSPGTGKRHAVRSFLTNRSKDEPQPSDWCYVHNFVNTDKPKAISLLAGEGREFQQDIEKLVQDIQLNVPAALEADDNRQKLQERGKEIFSENEKSMNKLIEEAKESGLMMVGTSTGQMLLAPSDKIADSPELVALAQNASQHLQPKLKELVENLKKLQKQASEISKDINREAAKGAIEVLVSPLRSKYAKLDDVIAHLDAIEEHLVENYDQVRSPEEEETPLSFLQQRKLDFDKYKINLLVDSSGNEGAPVVYEENPHFNNLIGRIDHAPTLGALVTNFGLIKPGALHRANGGYLILNARDILMQPFSWEALKRALRSKQVRIESLGYELGLGMSTVSLQPEPIPLDVQVILLGDLLLYYLLLAHEPDFNELFKVSADFSDEMDRSDKVCQLYAKLLAKLGKRENTRPMDRYAVAAMIEQAARQVGDQEKLTTNMRGCADLLCEADYWAGEEGAQVIGSEHVRKALDQHIYRADRIQQLLNDQIRRGVLLVDVEGEEIGQVNGLSVIGIGNVAFGRPSRITATTRMGREKVLDIEREVEMGGSIHSKGVMILSSLLASRYARDFPLSLSASLVFEQSYGMVDGDSASMAELCAILSSLAGLPIRQDLAMTGSVNQHGHAQAIGGATEKIEGFFDVCNTMGLTGKQGVLIPASNAKHLMLRPDIVKAAREDKFTVYTYENVDDAMFLLTGVEAGEKDSDGKYPEGSVNFLVDQRLHEMASLMKGFEEEKSDEKKA